MVPEIRELAEETERNRTIAPHIIARIRDAELLRTCRPKEFGGFEYDAVVALEIALAVSAATPARTVATAAAGTRAPAL